MTSNPPPNDPSASNPPEQPPPPYPGPGGSSASPPPYPGYGASPAPAEQPPPYAPQYGGGYGGQPAPYAGPSPYPGNRPGAVTAAATIAIVMSALSGLFWILAGLTFLVGGDAVVDEVQGRADFRRMLDDAGMSVEQFRDVVNVFGVVALAVGLLMLLAIIPAVGVLRGSGAARMTLIVLSVVTVLIGLFFTITGAVFGLLWVLAGGAVIALLFLGDAQSWFAGRKAGVG